MYYICKFSESWSIYDQSKNNSRQLDAEEVTILKKMFPSLLTDKSKILSAIKVETIDPKKLLQLDLKGNTG